MNNETCQSQNRLPFELWKEIFRLATAIQGKDEFSDDSSRYAAMDCEEIGNTTILSYEEQSQVIKTRLNIVRVCQYWHSIGIQGLWSHLRLVFPRITTKWIAFSVLNTLKTIPAMASFVEQLTIDIPSTRNPAWISTEVQMLLDLLPNLKYLNCPLILDIKPAQSHPKTIVLELYEHQASLLPPFSVTCGNIRILNLYLSGSNYIALPAVTLPQLETLTIRDVDIARSTGDGLYQKWIMPSLQNLAISTADMAAWFDCLGTWGTHLRKLQLSAELYCYSDLSRRVEIPELEELYLSSPCFEACIKSIAAPKLRRLGVFNGNYSLDSGNITIGMALDKYISLQQLCLKSDEHWGPTLPDGLDDIDVDGWRRRGVEIEFRPGSAS